MARNLLLILLAAAAACGGEPSPEAVCDHMMAVAKKTGVPIAAEGDPKARCVEKQKRMKEKIGAEAWGKVATCIMGKSDIRAMMDGCDPERAPAAGGVDLGGAEEYIRKSKGSEAQTSLRMMELGARQFAEAGAVEAGSMQAAPGFPRASAGPTPPLGTCCKGDRGRCAPDPALWSQPPWSDLDFTIEHPHYFSYEYKAAPDGKSFTALAYGDLDCDGDHSTFSLSGTIGPDGITQVGALARQNPLE
ncbi:MAG TPA: hypothetical protein VFU21_21305 [Kofleriaceae bacterium]|nr:hypothetical protein [Kofleriaceae bacterium]